jgi:hypothetical protein
MSEHPHFDAVAVQPLCQFTVEFLIMAGLVPLIHLGSSPMHGSTTTRLRLTASGVAGLTRKECSR